MSVLLSECQGSAAPPSSCHGCHASLSHEIGNTEKYKSWHCWDICMTLGTLKTNYCSLHMQALPGVHTKQWLFYVEVLHAPQLRQRSSSVRKFLSFSQYYLIITICIDSPSLIRDCERKPGLCINYNFSAGSPQGPEDMGNYSLCQWSCWTPADKETCWWGHRAQILQKRSHLYPGSLFRLPSFPSPPSWMSRGVRRRERVCLFLLSRRVAP